MLDNFPAFAKAVKTRFDEMAKEKLFVVDSDRDVIWEKYLAGFPAGTNPMFRVRTQHDCSCCRSFIRNVGNVVAIQNGTLSSVWDLNGLPSPYQEVADAMSSYIKGLPIRDLFLVKGARQGTPSNKERTDSLATLTHYHFSVDAPATFVSSAVDEKQGDARTTHAVLLRGIQELKTESVEMVLDLIQNNLLYRGEEHKAAVTEFLRLQQKASASKNPSLIAWSVIDSRAARFRNTAIGTLVQDLSEGVDLEKAVKSFETKVAPTNYKRPTALITKGMVESAMKTLKGLNLEASLERRHAKLSDVSIGSVLFVDNAIRGKMKGGVESLLMGEVKPSKFDPDKAEAIGVDDFVKTVLPKTESIQLYLENSHMANFVSLTAPIHQDIEPMFKWDNNFAWSYDGNVADSIKAKVKAAGGMVEGVALRVSLAWYNTDDLDLHIEEQVAETIGSRVSQGHRTGHIYYADKRSHYSGGILDVDMNVARLVRDPVENVRWTKKVPDGRYTVKINNFTRRESVDVGFTVEIEHAGAMETFTYNKGVPVKGNVVVAEINVKKGQLSITPIDKSLTTGSRQVDKWGVKSNGLLKVNNIVLSPNHWDENEVGNKHWFFTIDGCKNPDPNRGFYNEFLKGSLDKHRKVFEVLGDKTKCPVSDDQMSGVGFSSGRNDKVTVVAMGPKLNKAYTIVF